MFDWLGLGLLISLNFGSCLDSILHAEHKRILEEMRADYFVSQQTENGQRKHEGSPNPNGKVVGKGEGSESIINGIGSLEGEETETTNTMPFGYVFDLRNLFASSPKDEKRLAFMGFGLFVISQGVLRASKPKGNVPLGYSNIII